MPFQSRRRRYGSAPRCQLLFSRLAKKPVLKTGPHRPPARLVTRLAPALRAGARLVAPVHAWLFEVRIYLHWGFGGVLKSPSKRAFSCQRSKCTVESVKRKDKVQSVSAKKRGKAGMVDHPPTRMSRNEASSKGMRLGTVFRRRPQYERSAAKVMQLSAALIAQRRGKRDTNVALAEPMPFEA